MHYSTAQHSESDGSSPSSITELSIFELLHAAAKENDPHIWDVLYARFRRPILTFLRNSNRNCGGTRTNFNQMAEDWLHEVYLRLLQHDCRALRAFMGMDDVTAFAWLRRIADSVIKDYIKAQHRCRRTAVCGPVDVPTRHPAFAIRPIYTATLLRCELEAAIRQSKTRLGAREMLILDLLFRDWSITEIASMRELSMTRSGVWKVIRRWRDHLDASKFGKSTMRV